MSIDPRRPIVEVMARLGRETQLHLDERHRHFQITDKVILVISLLLAVLAIFNVYYVAVLYRNLDGIVNSMDSMYLHLSRVDRNMEDISNQVASFDRHIGRMDSITQNMTAMTTMMPKVRANMDAMASEMADIDVDMQRMTPAMGDIAVKMQHMTNGMSVMRQNVRQISGPMGSFNPFMPN